MVRKIDYEPPSPPQPLAVPIAEGKGKGALIHRPSRHSGTYPYLRRTQEDDLSFCERGVCCWKYTTIIIGKDTNRSGKSNPETLTCSASHYAAPCGRVFPAVPRLGTAACFRPRYQKDERHSYAYPVPPICCGLSVVPQTAWLGRSQMHPAWSPNGMGPDDVQSIFGQLGND